MTTIILTVFDRHPLLLMNTLSYLGANDLADTEILIVNDGSTMDYSMIQQMFAELPIRWIDTDTVTERPDTYNLDGHNNPAFVNNVAIKEAKGDTIVWLSSDCILPPHALKNMREWDLDRYVYTSAVVNMQDNTVFHGHNQRFYPMCWFLASSRAAIERAGEFDEEYLKGMAFEDNDFTARLALATGNLIVDSGVTIFHQMHPQTAYSDNWAGFKVSRSYTEKKWGGVPWSGDASDPLGVEKKTIGDCDIYSIRRREREAVA